jgi:hypothetical protein
MASTRERRYSVPLTEGRQADGRNWIIAEINASHLRSGYRLTYNPFR